MRRKLIAFTLSFILLVATNAGGAIYAIASENFVYIGGFPITVEVENEGAIVLGIKNDSENYPFSLYKNNNLKKGDVITSVNGTAVHSVADVDAAVENSAGNAVLLTIMRGNIVETASVYPIKEISSGKYKLGYRLKDKISGLGTMTFINSVGVFAALGHCIRDDESGTRIVCRGGHTYGCELIGVEKGEAKSPGKLKGRFVNCLYPTGDMCENGDSGLYGHYHGDYTSQPKYACAGVGAIKPGAASIYTTVGRSAALYDIEIVRAFRQTEPDEKGMVIKITDTKLIELTGGIVQGMSGSPIVQNDKIVGAVTHVFTNNPLMGYGIYAEWMLRQAECCHKSAA